MASNVKMGCNQDQFPISIPLLKSNTFFKAVGNILKKAFGKAVMKINNHKFLLITYVILLTTVPIVSTDMYLPALPKMMTLFGAPLELVNLTLAMFFIPFAASSLIWGTLSDKYGRKPILIISLVTYIVASALCVVAGNIYQLILLRAFQGTGGGAAVAVSVAIVKDVFEGRERERVLVYLSSLMAVAPVVAPIIGAEILRFFSWRGIFAIFSLFGTVLFLGCLFFTETAVKDSEKSILDTFGNLRILVRNPGFISPLVIFSIASIPTLMFVGGASDIFITHFGLSEQAFSLFFGFNAAISVIGPFAYILMARYFSTESIIGASFFLIAASGVWIILSGDQGPVLFALAAVPGALGGSLNRPPSMNILLEQGKRDTGTASSLMNFSFLTTGCIGMFFISLAWTNRIFIFGLTCLIVGLLAMLFWPRAWKRCNPSLVQVASEVVPSVSC